MMETASPPTPHGPCPMVARRWLINGRVQGVGFRPFVYRLAQRYKLSGWVQNLSGQVLIFAQGDLLSLLAFEAALFSEIPPLARPQMSYGELVEVQPCTTFSIVASSHDAVARIHVPPDSVTCDDCLRELHDARERRYHYPFINCTQCGPRYTLITRMPYDRPNTTMAGFPLCEQCRAEYESPLDRRFHAEPVACPQCGPRLRFYAPPSASIVETAAALTAAVSALRSGRIVAVKGIGGYHLMCDARDTAAIMRLRERKPRPHKPLAVMFPWCGEDGLDVVRNYLLPNTRQAQLLCDPRRPIVLMTRRPESDLPEVIAPGLNEIGALLPYSPLRTLLLEEFGAPLVATSANISGEPVLTDNIEVEARLPHVADAFLHHNRPIARPADDAVYRLIADVPRPLRLGRGTAPLELTLPFFLREPVLAVGGHTKNTIALAWENRVVISPHIGDLSSPRSLNLFEQVIDDLQALYQINATHIVCDAHPGYASTRWARRMGLPVQTVLHHHAHASALAGELPEVRKWLVFAWDGVGYGADGSLWGGEALLGMPGHWQHVASLRRFRVPGGERAGREPWRAAAALCWACGLDWSAMHVDCEFAHEAWIKQLNAPETSAAGRLFDAAAALLGLVETATFEAQGPMLLEAICATSAATTALPMCRDEQGMWRSDWSPLVAYLRDERLSIAERAMGFHMSLAQAIVDQACQLRDEHGAFVVGLGGGVFQNKIFTEQVFERLINKGFDVRLGERVPSNDAGISFGQVIESGANQVF